nr:hypothetical protein [Trichocoleus desertorum]
MTLAIEGCYCLLNEGLVLSDSGKVSATSEIERLLDAVLEVAMSGFDGVE